MKIVIELIGEDATEATLRHIAESPDCCLSDGELAIRAEVIGTYQEKFDALLPYLTGKRPT